MLLRPRQEAAVEASAQALEAHGNTLLVAPTGAGKTVMLSAVAERMRLRTLVLQHRDELVAQNRGTMLKYAPWVATSVVDANTKNMRGDVVYAMVQTQVRNLDLIHPEVGMVVVDEAHHTAANSYKKIVERAQELNPAVKLYGVTATPNRGDKKALRSFFDNVADQITLGELIATGHLVRPRTFVVDLGVNEELRHVKRGVSDFDMNEVERILDKVPLNDKVVEKWKDVAGDRQTVVFCSTVEHATHVTETFAAAGVSARMVDGTMAEGERKAVLKGYDRGDFQVIVNVMVLTEGWDHQPTSCVVLLRPSSFKSTMIQMIGRGLRRMDPERYPGWPPKMDCIVLDFGTSILTHGSLEQDVELDPAKNTAPPKDCPGCGASVPGRARDCPICGHTFDDMAAAGGGGAKTPDQSDGLSDFSLTEIDLFKASPYRWEDMWGDETTLVAAALDAWAMAIEYGGVWHAIGGAKDAGIRHLALGDKLTGLAAADDFLRQYGDTESAGKAKRWLFEPATLKQRTHIARKYESIADDPALTKYRAACFLTWHFNERPVQAKLVDRAQALVAG